MGALEFRLSLGILLFKNIFPRFDIFEMLVKLIFDGFVCVVTAVLTRKIELPVPFVEEFRSVGRRMKRKAGRKRTPDTNH